MLGHSLMPSRQFITLPQSLPFTCIESASQLEVKVLGLLGTFLSMCLALGIVMAFLIPYYTWELFINKQTRPYFSMYLLFQSLSMIVNLSISCPKCCPLLVAAVSSIFTFKQYQQKLPGKQPQPWEGYEKDKTQGNLCAGPRGSHRRGHNHRVLRFVLLSLALAGCTRIVGCHLHGHLFGVVCLFLSAKVFKHQIKYIVQLLGYSLYLLLLE